MPTWATLLLLLLPLLLIAGQYWRSGRKDFWRYGLIWIIIIALIAIGYDALSPRFTGQDNQAIELPGDSENPKQPEI
jgi:hypothetical protein